MDAVSKLLGFDLSFVQCQCKQNCTILSLLTSVDFEACNSEHPCTEICTKLTLRFHNLVEKHMLCMQKVPGWLASMTYPLQKNARIRFWERLLSVGQFRVAAS